MSELFEPVDEHDRDLALTAPPTLAAFNTAGVVTAADIHIATALGRLGNEQDPDVLLAIALTSRAVRHGSVCLELAEVGSLLTDVDLPWPEPAEWAAAVGRSPLLALGVLHWEHGLLYLDRYHEQETQVLDDLTARAASTPPFDPSLLAASLARVFADPGFDEQRAACTHAAGRWTTVITGGPGTGKTTAVAGLLVALHEQAEAQGHHLRIAMAAPTGKAAARLEQAVRDSAKGFSERDRDRLAGTSAMTLHRLLRTRPGNRTRFRHHRGNRLPHDVVVVDETSMVSLTMMARLLEAVRPDSRLVFVGDPAQLSSVDAGAVLADIVHGFDGRADSPVVALTTAHRYGAEIGALAEALRVGDADAVISVLSAGHSAVEWVRDQDPASAIRATALPSALAVRDAAATGNAAKALAALDRHRLLCAHRDGPFGVRHWNRRVEQWLTQETGDPLYESAYLGRPVLVTANDYALGVYNGDTGVVVDTRAGRRVVVATGEGPLSLAPSRLGDVETMHVMTIHKSQGSQADVVTVLLPDEDSRLLTRELFYTAVTRARTRVRIVGPEAAVRAAIGRQAQRASGLRARLADG
ncbi:MAG: helicase/exodeoxyribonuclease alpha subunit [Nocardioides sp.]|jgi:exodeoxyribonuclease V alpha subunit|uniref:exodeoxyribonuclease V subunit alpha n=1 Tax=Nocardioides sp. TaxID=35761 RepID=UPI0026321938|nr:exodeoxyribonuclease V subunit alpha [Nocardioides sp.]MCW2834600.1 helicase/exodeoxyribonuclease alpha subunit [Nocardioides sp.]